MSQTIGWAIAILVVALAGLAVGARLGHRPPRRSSSPPPAAYRGVSEDVVRRLLGSMRTGVVVVDASDAPMLRNAAAEALAVVRDDRIVLPEAQRLVRLARGTGQAQDVTTEIAATRTGYDSCVVRLSVVPLDAAGQVAVFVDDVTEARRLDAVRRDFVANISHELKTPVGALMLLSEAMEQASDDADAVRHFATRMGQEGQRLARTITELIDLSRLEGADPMPTPAVVSVDEIIADALDQTRAAADSAGIAGVAGDRTGLIVHGDRAQLTTAIVNLVGNAIAYSPVRTNVAVGARIRLGEEGDHGEAADRTAYVEISVADRGIGIAEADQQRIFERFYRADPARSRATGGTGLGLAIVKHIATNHGGEVTVWSVEGAGSTFTLRIPAAAEIEPARVPADANGVVRRAAHRPPEQPSMRGEA